MLCDKENYELDLQRKQKVVGLVWPISCNNAEGDPQRTKQNASPEEPNPTGYHTNSPQQQSDGPFWPNKLTVPGGWSYKQSTTRFRWTIWHREGWLCQKDIWPMDHHTDSPQQQYNGGWKDLRRMDHHTNSPQQQSDGPFWLNSVDCARKTQGPWIVILTVRNNNLMDQIAPKIWLCPMGHNTHVHNNSLMDHFDPKSWLCPKGHHTSSPQQGFDGPFWHRQGWLCQKDLWPVEHHTDSPQQQSDGGMWRKQLTVPCGSSYKQSATAIWWTVLT